MPILELFPKPAPGTDQTTDQTGSRDALAIEPLPRGARKPVRPPQANSAATGTPPPPGPGAPKATSAGTIPAVKIRSGRYGELEEHELIHLLDSLDDERARARFRESIYISVIVYLAIAWFLFYGPRVLFHQPQLQDPIALMREHDKLTQILPPTPPRLKIQPKIDRKTLQQLEKQPRQAPPAPQPAAPPPPEEAHNTPPVAAPLPMPAAPRPAPAVEAPLPAAPLPKISQNSPSPRDAMQGAMRGAMGRSGAQVGAPGSTRPLQAGAEILSDTGNWDPSAYMRRLHDDIQRNWEPLIPEEVQAPLLKRGIVGIRFTILRDGSIADPMVLETRSGDVALDKAAWYAITSEGQFPPLPKEVPGQRLELRIGFFYNTPIER